MTEPRAAGTRRWLVPRIVFPVLAVVVVIVVLFTPTRQHENDDGRLSTYRAGANGARGLAELLALRGWTVERRLTSLDPPLDTTTVWAVLAPMQPPTVVETHALLEAVRRGASLLWVVQPETPLADSLRVRRTEGGGPIVLGPDSADCEGRGDVGLLRWPGETAMMYAVIPLVPLPNETTFAEVRDVRRGLANDSSARRHRETGIEPTVIGFTLGRGRVVAVADPDFLRNDVLRVCRWGAGVRTARALDWLATPLPHRRLTALEYHQGFGRQPSLGRAVRRAMFETREGRTALQALAALLIVLAAAAPRALPPRARERHERRSPLEHAGALARAYEQVGATRLATRRLVRGLRRRYDHASGGRVIEDEAWLRAVAGRHPPVADDVTLLLDCLTRDGAPASLRDSGRAIARIDSTLRPPSLHS